METASRIALKRRRPPHWDQTPSLPKLLCMHVPGHVTMLRMRDVSNDAQALLMEGRLEAVMAPTCNSVAPGGALLRDT